MGETLLTPKTAGNLGHHDCLGTVLACASSDHIVASADEGGAIRRWSLRAKKPIGTHENPDGEVHQLVFLPDNAGLLSVDGGFTIRLWEPGTNRAVSTWKPPRADVSLVASMALSSDGRFVATGEYGGTVELWDLKKFLRNN